MSFAWPHLLWTLLIPCAIAAREFARRHRVASRLHPKILRAEAGPHSLRLAEAAGGTPTRPRLWLCAGLALCLLAMARPQWGRMEEPVFDQAREILLAVDLSRSMLTPDVKPSRLDRTKLLIQALLEKLAGERVGLVVFAGTSFLQAPLSADYEILREFLPALGPEFLPQGGTHYGAMLDTSIQAFGSIGAADRFLVVLSDGEATDSEWRAKVDELKKKNIRVISLGVGTASGGMIPDSNGGFVKDERGAVVLSRLESGTLQDLARATGGTYRDASAWIDLADLVAETIEAGRKGDFVEKNLVRLVERFQWPLALGLWCLLVSFYHEFPVRPRPRDLKLPPSPSPRPRPATAAASSLTLLLALATFQPPRAFAQPQPPAPPPPPEALTKIVTRLAAAESHSPQDWAEFGRETSAWGSRLQSSQQPVPEGPVRDALQAVDIGSRQSPAATDWKKLREDLETLLKKPEDKQQDKEQPKDQSPQDQQNKDQKQQNQSSDQQQQSQEQKQDGSPKSDQSQQSSQPSEQRENQNPGDSPLGDMDQKQPPPPENNTRKVGGTPEGKSEASQAPTDPSLALPMQKLEQLRAQDSPAQLFQMMDGPKKPATKTGKDW